MKQFSKALLDLCLGLLNIPLKLEIGGKKRNLCFMAAANGPHHGKNVIILSHKETFGA